MLQGCCPNCFHRFDAPVRPGAILRTRRLQLGWTQEEVLFAAESERSQNWYACLELYRRRAPESREWTSLCEAMGIDPAMALKGKLRELSRPARPEIGWRKRR